MKKVLLIGGTGALGVYLTEELLSMGYAVDVLSLDDVKSDNPRLCYIQGDALDDAYLSTVLKNEYNGIVDFMINADPHNKFAPRMKMLLESCDHYIFLSTYRIYGNAEIPIREESPRLLELATERPDVFGEDYLKHKDTEYSLYKAMGEDMLHQSGLNNYTIIRPAITYSKFRFQLVCLEAPVVVHRMMSKKKLILPEAALDVMGTMSWSGDVAKMISRLLFNKKAFTDVFTVATAEHHTWREIASYYEKIGGLKYHAVDTETFLQVWAEGGQYARWQLQYDRLFDRVIDNSKILNFTGLKQSELMPLYDGLKKELSALPKNFVWPKNDTNDRMDRYILENRL